MLGTYRIILSDILFLARREVEALIDQVKEIMEKIRPALQRDGGDVELVEVTDEGVVKVKLKGACSG